MDNDSFTFDLVDICTPKEVVEKYLRQIVDSTRGYVAGNINEYKREIDDLNDEEKEIDIERSLGEVNNVDNCYEVYLTVKGLDKYKYRLMFIDYGSISYPVTIILSVKLAYVYHEQYKDYFILDSMKALEMLMNKIFNSNVLKNLIQDLINEAIRRERMGQGKNQ